MSSTHLGWAMITEKGSVIDTGVIVHKSTDYKERCKMMTMQFYDSIAKTLSHDDVVIIEEPEIMGMEGRNSGSNNMLFFAVGALSSLLYYEGVSHEFVRVRIWKGTTPKHVIWNRLVEKYGSECPSGSSSKPWELDSVDGLGIADWYLRRSNEIIS